MHFAHATLGARPTIFGLLRLTLLAALALVAPVPPADFGVSVFHEGEGLTALEAGADLVAANLVGALTILALDSLGAVLENVTVRALVRAAVDRV